MRKSWFYKLLFSYLPVFFIVISFLIAVFFFSMGEITRVAAERVNRGAAAHALEVVDHSLQSIEQMMIKELMTTDGIQNFYNKTLWDEPYHRMVRPSEKLRDIVTQFPLIQSMYMVRWEDETVLSVDAAMPLSRFEDRPFVEEFLRTGEGGKWTALRGYKELTNQNAVDVVTLVKPYPVPAGDQGVLVVNVRGASLERLVREMFDSGFLQAVIVDRNGDPLYATGVEPLPSEQTVTEAVSEYTGWTIKSQIRGGAFYQFASSFNGVLLASGAIAIVAAVLYITYISKKNYRPIASLTERVHAYAQSRAERLLKNGGKDEFAFLETALDQMIEQSDELLGRQEEHLQARKRQWVKDTLEGDYDTVSERVWPERSERFGWNASRVKAAVIVVEIDRYTEFCEQYSRRDQSLLKFLLGNVVHETGTQREMLLFGEWLQANKWCAFLQLKEGQSTEDAAALAQQVVTWMQHNVDFSVTIGLGDVVDRAEDISASYEQALRALQYKTTLGNGRVIGHWEVPDAAETASRGGIADFRGLIQLYKLGEAEWEAHYERALEGLRTGALPKQELSHQINYVVYQLSRELSELNADYQRVWSEEAMPRIHRLLKHFDTFEELSGGLRDILTEAQRRMAAQREARTYSSTMQQVRAYIADNFGNPDLSLNHLSDAFELNPKYVSHLFKEEFGEKFIEYVANVRMEKAKELLDETTLSIQDIALRVGYTHSFSFIRMFKKIAGLTPGDYRKRSTSKAQP